MRLIPIKEKRNVPDAVNLKKDPDITIELAKTLNLKQVV